MSFLPPPVVSTARKELVGLLPPAIADLRGAACGAEAQRQHNKLGTILVKKVSKEKAAEFGELVADPETKELLHYTEKPETFVRTRPPSARACGARTGNAGLVWFAYTRLTLVGLLRRFQTHCATMIS